MIEFRDATTYEMSNDDLIESPAVQHVTSATEVAPIVRSLVVASIADADTAIFSFTIKDDPAGADDTQVLYGFRRVPASEAHVGVFRSDKDMFRRLVAQWREERPLASSSIAEMIACPSYLRIIGMGGKALPLIIEQLESEGDEPDHWCAALEAVTGEDPVPEDAQGDSVRIAQAWISWSRSKFAWHFQTSLTPTAESPANELNAITALLGLPNLM